MACSEETPNWSSAGPFAWILVKISIMHGGVVFYFLRYDSVDLLSMPMA